nr:hypothetical protein BaRGS_029797 [Batillaria attramentaria]
MGCVTLAARIGDSQALKDMLQSSKLVKVDVPDNGETPLFYAASQMAPTTLQTLIDAGADVNQQDETGKTALMIACIHTFEIVTELLKGADPRLPGKRTRGIYMFVDYLR